MGRAEIPSLRGGEYVGGKCVEESTVIGRLEYEERGAMACCQMGQGSREMCFFVFCLF